MVSQVNLGVLDLEVMLVKMVFQDQLDLLGHKVVTENVVNRVHLDHLDSRYI